MWLDQQYLWADRRRAIFAECGTGQEIGDIGEVEICGNKEGTVGKEVLGSSETLASYHFVEWLKGLAVVRFV